MIGGSYFDGYLDGTLAARAGTIPPEALAAAGLASKHPVNPSRDTQPDNVRQYRAGYLAGRADKDAPARLPGGKPPRRTGCPIKLLLIPYYLARHLIGGR